MKTPFVLAAMAIATVAVPAFALTLPLPDPANATLVGEVTLNEIRTFPEQTLSRGGAHIVEEAQAVQADDKLYETRATYPTAVSYYDRSLPGAKFAVVSRTTSHTSTVWSLKTPDGSLARLAVRNTNPTTIEWVVAQSEADTPPF